MENRLANLECGYESLLTEEVQAKYKKFVEDYNLATGTS
ncbi:unnamed protein product [Haemonchus placei]|uniref:Uncharacterized protein n=1 Tax=Haemonchus placei TaxID=6290 RepID=A0A3P8B7U9_HAEPC|nr:unnamed protein product [Haemonchus placei]